jgi:hypothetical protein
MSTAMFGNINSAVVPVTLGTIDDDFMILIFRVVRLSKARIKDFDDIRRFSNRFFSSLRSC